MKWIKENWLRLGILFSLLIVAFSASYFFLASSPHSKTESLNKVPSKETLLRDRWQKYWDSIMVGLCQQNYDNYLTVESRVRYSLDDYQKYGCLDHKEWVKTVHIKDIVFTGDDRADLKLVFTPSNLNDGYHWDVETWYFQNGTWYRNF